MLTDTKITNDNDLNNTDDNLGLLPFSNSDLVDNSFGRDTEFVENFHIEKCKNWSKKVHEVQKDWTEEEKLIWSSMSTFEHDIVDETEEEKRELELMREFSINSSNNFSSFHYLQLKEIKHDIEGWIKKNILRNPLEENLTRKLTIDTQQSILDEDLNITEEGIDTKTLFVEKLMISKLGMIWDILDEINDQLETTWEERIRNGKIPNQHCEGYQYIGLLKLVEISETVFEELKKLHGECDRDKGYKGSSKFVI